MLGLNACAYSNYLPFIVQLVEVTSKWLKH